MASHGGLINPPRFDGSGDVEAWIRAVVRVTKLREWTDNDDRTNTVLNILSFFDGEARAWADHVKLDTVMRWEDAETMILSRWRPSLSSMTVISSLLATKKTTKESFHTFADRLRGIGRLSKDVGEEWLVEAFVRGLPPRYHATTPLG